jgi:basic membrane lipoprotein Med (substrate-binding protein (PBP1-ABC) superfamily)
MKKSLMRILGAGMIICAAAGPLFAGGGQEAEASGEKDQLKIGLLVPGSINDGGWSNSAYQGLLKIEEEMGAEVSYMEVKSPADVVDGFRDYGARGFDIVFGHSYDYQDAAKRVAPQFPDTIYITSGGTTVMDNVSPIYFEFEQATYLAGVVAASMTRTGKVGSVGSVEMPAISKSIISFEDGLKDTNPDAEHVVFYIGSQDDVGKAKEIALAMINQGVDIFWVSANAAGQGVLQAVEESKAKGVKIFGSYGPWSESSPDVVIADLMIDASNAFKAATARILEGFEPGEIRVGIEDGVVVYNWNKAMDIPANVMKAFNNAKAKIDAGEITIDIGTY